MDKPIKSEFVGVNYSAERSSIKIKIILRVVILIMVLAASASLAYYYQASGLAGKIIISKFVPAPMALDPNFLTQVNECFIPVASVYGYTLRITSGFRSLTEQETIYNSGRTLDGHIVSWAEPGHSLHNYGFAVDVVDRWRGYDIDFDKLAKIGTYCGLEQVDPPHFEHRAGLTTADFAAGKRPPPLTLPCQALDILAKENKLPTLTDLQACGTPKF